MGTYVYNLRKKTTTLITAEGPIKANHFAYAYKEWLGGAWDEAIENRRNAVRDRAQRTAENAWHETDHVFAIFADDGKVKDGDPVYTDVAKPLWYDVDALPARLIGFARKIGSRWHVVDGTPWELRCGFAEDSKKTWVRSRVENGVPFEERRDHAEACGGLSDFSMQAFEARGRVWDLPGQPSPKLASSEIEVHVGPNY